MINGQKPQTSSINEVQFIFMLKIIFNDYYWLIFFLVLT